MYRAKYGISCGVSPGFGVKSPDYVEKEELFEAGSNQEAFEMSMEKANYFADEYLSNPRDDKTTVTLLSLVDSSGKDVPFEKKDAVVKRTMFEHFLQIALKE